MLNWSTFFIQFLIFFYLVFLWEAIAILLKYFPNLSAKFVQNCLIFKAMSSPKPSIGDPTDRLLIL